MRVIVTEDKNVVKVSPYVTSGFGSISDGLDRDLDLNRDLDRDLDFADLIDENENNENEKEND